MVYDLTIVTDVLIGDFIMWLDTVAAYRKKYEGKKVLLVCDERLIDIAKLDNIYTDIIGFNLKKMKEVRYAFSMSRSFHRFRTDILLYPSTTRHMPGEILSCSIRAKKRIGFRGYSGDNTVVKSLMRKLFGLRYTQLIDAPCENEIRALEYFTREVVESDYSYGENPLTVPYKDFGISGKYALIALSSSMSFKIWSIDKFVGIINKIPTRYSVVLSGAGEDDIVRARTIEKLVADKKRVVNMVNRTSIKELLSLIAQASFVIGNDSAAVHIAAATRVPSICVLHGAHFDRFLPYPSDLKNAFYNPRAVFYQMGCFGCCYKCDKPISNGSLWCLDKVSVEMVASELDKLFKEMEERK